MQYKSLRTPWLRRTIAEYKRRNLETVVEIGTIRPGSTLDGDGWITLCLAESCSKIHTVDINPDCKLHWDSTYAATYPHVEAVTADGIEYLEQFESTIDLLVLDGWDGDRADSPIKHLCAYLIGKEKLSPNGLILIDDACPKANEIMPRAQDDGFEFLIAEYMILLARPYESA